jgi:hypothetical protein
MAHRALTYITIAFCIAISGRLAAQPNSYIYIQGDKTIPFYVKVEGKMQPRYGKNYCIIPQLKAGKVNIEILFQQNILPPQSFTIDVPENGYRGFLLDKQKEGYALYDLQTKKYLDIK